MTPLKSRTVRWLIPTAVLVLLVAAHSLWLGALGSFLVNSQEPFPADMAVVLAGDETGGRIVTAAELVRAGYAPKVLVSGPEYYGAHESDLAIALAVRQGYPADWFIPLPNRTDSTKEEAQCVLDELQRRHVRRFIVVTSNFHTRRAAAAYRALAPAGSFRVVAAPYRPFAPRGWWHTRAGQKLFFMEWIKTLAAWAGK